LVDVSFTLEGNKVVISYVCEDRVDFRELVKDLASQLKVRVELRQIGIRDQAKMVGGIGFCGKECCCKKYLNDFDKVSIKMAKTQGLSLNPTKISGICGRLMCCLAYENEFYSEISVKMPKINSRIKTKDGIGTNIYNNLLKQKVTVKIEKDNDITITEYDLADIEILPKLNQQPQPKKEKKEEVQKIDMPIEESVENNQNKQKNNKFNKKHKNKNDSKK
jgi:cell fate regulator YaaT (PSP1 superfamily)